MINRKYKPSVSPDSHESGWPTLYKTVREADISKIDDCRDDIDTLLVFAGLYSAVLTAFVIESYKSLQQDKEDIVVDLLQQLVRQNFTIGPRYLNSTNPCSPLTPFEPPLWAIRVNILWFTSLLLSLVSASFGILVKQWLREYLAIEYTAPRERLRARQYRNPALTQWKVFEIAAFLPVLLQVSVGIFFVGLCFFTAAVHRRVSLATIPLVCGWTFLLLITTIAPLFSPRCPFKTTFLKLPLKIGRHYIALPSRRLFTFIRLAICFVLRQAHAFGWIVLSIGHIIFEGQKYIALCVQTVRTSLRAVSSFIRAHIPHSIPLINIVRHTTSLSAVHLIAIRYASALNQVASTVPSLAEEEAVIKTEEDDVQILLSIDSLMFDDAMIPIMLDTLWQQASACPEKTIEFASQIIGRRIGRALDTPHITFTLDLRPLSKQVWSTTIDAVAGTLVEYSRASIKTSSPGWVLNAIMILLSPSQFELSDSAIHALRELHIVPSRSPDHLCTGSVALNICFPGLLRSSLTHRYYDENTIPCLRCILDVYKTLLSQDRHFSYGSLRQLLDTHMSEEAFVTSSKALMQDILDVVVHFLRRTWSDRKADDWREINGAREAFHILLQYGKTSQNYNDVLELCRRLCSSARGTETILEQFASLHPRCRVSADNGKALDLGLILASEQEQVVLTLNKYCEGEYDGIPLDYVRLCGLWTSNVYLSRSAGKKFWSALAKAIEKYHRLAGWRNDIGREYWHSDVQFSSPKALFKDDQELACGCLKACAQNNCVSTEIFDALWLFIPQDRIVGIECSLPGWREYTPGTL